MNATLMDSLRPSKVTLAHLERLAFIYVRQSTMKQVLHNKESQENQYHLQQRAEVYGWSAEQIRIIDSDLGRSGSESIGRAGFQELVAEVSMGHAGIVFGYEVSRLARNNQDWYHLLDLSAVFGTLIADNDGIYDPRLYNDRLLLGLKGTLSEAELHLLRQRLDAGRMNQVKRGAYRQRLPSGYIRLPDGRVVQDPDGQVQHAIEMVFKKFRELGSVNKVIRYLRRNQVLLPRRQTNGPQANQVVWKVASGAAVMAILKNPAYAGVFAYGQRQGDPTLRKPGRAATGSRRKPMTEWLQCLQNAYPAYISWEQFLANQDRIQQNGLKFTDKRQQAQGIVRNGPGLLQGMVMCGRCGHHMRTVYKKTPRYICDGLIRTTIVTGECNSVRAPVVDELVVQAFFEAIQPSRLDALEAILVAQRLERERLEQHWQEQLKRMQYEVHLAQRQYDAVDPDNRLVAAELERRWEASLKQLRQTQEAYDHFQQIPLPDKIPASLREMFQNVSNRLPELWPRLSNRQKKELLRSLIRQVIIKRPVPDRLEIRIVWVSNYYSDHACLTPVYDDKNVSGYDQKVARIEELCKQGYDDQQMAEQLTKEGFHSARTAGVTRESVEKIRLKRGWILRIALIRGADEWDGCWTVNGLAKQVGVKERAIYNLMYFKKAIPAEFVLHELNSGFYLFPKDARLIDLLKKRLGITGKIIKKPEEIQTKTM
jgi:DNA invertase Pin-like site-specific DNA recombinase